VQGKTQRRRLSRRSKFAIFGDLPAFSASSLDTVVSTASLLASRIGYTCLPPDFVLFLSQCLFA
jgi:hypothetical protein